MYYCGTWLFMARQHTRAQAGAGGRAASLIRTLLEVTARSSATWCAVPCRSRPPRTPRPSRHPPPHARARLQGTQPPRQAPRQPGQPGEAGTRDTEKQRHTRARMRARTHARPRPQAGTHARARTHARTRAPDRARRATRWMPRYHRCVPCPSPMGTSVVQDGRD